MERTKAKTLRLLLRLVGPLLLVVVVWRLQDSAALLDVVRQADPRWLLVALAAALPAIHLKVVRWRMLLAMRGHRYTLGKSYGAVLASLYLGMTTPGRVGEVLRIQYVRHDLGVRYAEGLAITVMDRVSDLYVLAAFVTVGATYFVSFLSNELVFATAGAVVVALAAPAVLLIPGLAERVVGRLWAGWARGSGEDSFEVFLTTLRGLVRGSALYAVPTTIAAYLCIYLQGWLIARALGLHLTYFDVASLLAMTSLLGLMPISVSGLGLRELLLALVFPALGMRAEQGVAFGLLVFLFMYMIYVVAGFLAWQLRPPPVAPAAAEDDEGAPG